MRTLFISIFVGFAILIALFAFVLIPQERERAMACSKAGGVYVTMGNYGYCVDKSIFKEYK